VQAVASPPSTPADRPVPLVSAPLLSPSPAARRAPLVSGTAPDTVVVAHPSASPLPLCSAGSTRTAHVSRARRFRAAVGRALLAGRQGPPMLVPRFLHASASAAFFLLRPTPSTPRQTPSLSVCPALRAPFPRPNSGRSAVAVHPLSEPPTEPFPCQSRPHLTPLPPSPWCRARVPSSMTTVPAPPPSIATAPRRPTAPPTRRRLGEPRHRSSCPAPPRDPTGAQRQHLLPSSHRRAAGEHSTALSRARVAAGRAG
jgi:hypothetical protein